MSQYEKKKILLIALVVIIMIIALIGYNVFNDLSDQAEENKRLEDRAVNYVLFERLYFRKSKLTDYKVDQIRLPDMDTTDFVTFLVTPKTRSLWGNFEFMVLVDVKRDSTIVFTKKK